MLLGLPITLRRLACRLALALGVMPLAGPSVPVHANTSDNAPLAVFLEPAASVPNVRPITFEQPAFQPLAFQDPVSQPATNGAAGFGSPSFAAPSLASAPYASSEPADCPCAQEWSHHLLPDGLIYRTYLAGIHEPRIASVWSHENSYGAQWDTALGARVAIYRYGTEVNNGRADGWEFELEGAVFPRLDPVADSTPLIATDYRIGLPVVYGAGPWQFKMAYYHISSHLGDEWLVLHPGIRRLNSVRDELQFGMSVYIAEDFRLYGEFGYAPSPSDGAKPLEFQFGAEYSPVHHNDFRGAPFAAINAVLREENDFGGYLVLQAGWQWRNGNAGHLLRVGVQFMTGKSDQGEFYDLNEQRTGFGIWYDF